MERIVIVDPSVAGISGDMFLSSLISLGADEKSIKDLGDTVLRCIDGVSHIEIGFTDVIRGGVKAKKLEVKIEEGHTHRRGAELVRAIECIAKRVELSEEALRFSLNTLKMLLEIEAYIHGRDIDEIELHEIGSVDTIIDIVGSALALQSLNLFNAYTISMPVALGGGYVKFSHGVYPVPAPATIEILKRGKAIVVGGMVNGELTTPTGAALLINFVQKFDYRYPLFELEAIGYGAGEKNFDAIPNILRIVTGRRIDEVMNYRIEDIVVLETDIDDVTGEVVGYTFEKLLNSGARDVSIIPIHMKKNRPGYTVRVIADMKNYRELARILIEETGTLGVRYSVYSRIAVPDREIVPIELDINGYRRKILLKISRDGRGNIVNVKPEYESVREVAHELGIPLREVLNIVYKTINGIMQSKSQGNKLQT